MWNTFLERGKELAEKAKAAAETIDKQIDATVGLDTSHAGGGAGTTSTSVTEDLSAGLKGASNLLFGKRSDHRTGSPNNNSSVVSGEYLSQRESIGFVAGEDDDEDEDAWGDEDDIVIPDESSSQVQEDIDDSKRGAGVEPLLEANGIDDDDDNNADHDVLEEEDESTAAPAVQDPSPVQAVDDVQQQDPTVESEIHSDLEEDVPAEMISIDVASPSMIDTTPTTETESDPPPTTQEMEELYEAEAPHETGLDDDMASEEPDDSPDGVQNAMDSTGWAEESTRTDSAQDADGKLEDQYRDDEADGAAPVDASHSTSLEIGDDENVKSTGVGSDTAPSSHDPYHDSAHSVGRIMDIPLSNETTDDDPIASSPILTHEATQDEATIERATETQAASFVADSSADHDASSDSKLDATRRTAALPTESNQHDGPSALQIQQELDSQREITRLLEQRLDQLTTQLQQREDQLVSKTTQLSVLQSEWDAERLDLQAKLQATKDEAKRRIQKAKERVDAVEAKLRAVSSDDAQQADIIAALRSEGERLAIKQSEMEKAVRAAKGESRQLREQLEDEAQQKDDALAKIQKLEVDLKDTRDKLASARKGESQADKLESELASAREDLERKGSTILSLEQELKEKTAEIKELVGELENSRAGAAIDNQLQQEKLMKHHEESVKDLELKLRTAERDAAIREDALRHEVDELRKRWQDAVRRADTLSMDIQSSTAPLMRQLESAERQSRIRAAAAAEIETKLRRDLEETVVANEKLTKDCNELQMKLARLDRRAKEADGELQSSQAALESKAAVVKQLEEKLQKMEADGARLKQEWAEVERLANEGVTRVRSELTQTMVDSEQRHLSQVESLKAELAREREKVQQLEGQMSAAVSNAGLPSNRAIPSIVGPREAEPQRLRKSVGQAQILAGALGFDEERHGGDDESDDAELDEFLVDSAPGDSFAAIEELSSRLKAAKVELLELKKSLSDSERSRNQLAEELGESRVAKEKLPLFEAKVKELTAENEEQALEIMGLREDIDEVRELYRAQLNMLLEEKARIAKPAPDENGTSATSQTDETFFAASATDAPDPAASQG